MKSESGWEGRGLKQHEQTEVRNTIVGVGVGWGRNGKQKTENDRKTGW